MGGHSGVPGPQTIQCLLFCVTYSKTRWRWGKPSRRPRWVHTNVETNCGHMRWWCEVSLVCMHTHTHSLTHLPPYSVPAHIPPSLSAMGGRYVAAVQGPLGQLSLGPGGLKAGVAAVCVVGEGRGWGSCSALLFLLHAPASFFSPVSHPGEERVWRI